MCEIDKETKHAAINVGVIRVAKYQHPWSPDIGEPLPAILPHRRRGLRAVGDVQKSIFRQRRRADVDPENTPASRGCQPSY